MQVDMGAGKPVHVHQGETYYFCSEACHAKFATAPDAYLGAKPAQQSMAKGTVYTCPMHPQIEQIGPGSCPICGMALEPKGGPGAEDRPNLELADFSWVWF